MVVLAAQGFVDPRTGDYRTVPVEILQAGASAPLYRQDAPYAGAGTYPALPFRAAGSLGMVHSSANPDDGSSEFFMTMRELPGDSPLLNLLDGTYSHFGFILDAEAALSQVGRRGLLWAAEL